MIPLDLVGQQFGKLLVIKKIPCVNKHTVFMCKCDCGTIRDVVGSSLTNGRVSCCGCNNGDARRKVKYLNPQLYEVWKGMRARCRYKYHIGWSNYGGRGVGVSMSTIQRIKSNKLWVVSQ